MKTIVLTVLGLLSASRILARVLLLAVTVPGLVQAQTAGQLPAGVRESYDAYVDQSVSDEFNRGVLETRKWGRRSYGNGVGDFVNDTSK